MWLDYQNAQGLDDLKSVCSKMHKMWVVDLDAILPAPIPDIDATYREVRDAARTATDHCTAMYTEADGNVVDQDFVTLQSKWTDLMQAEAKWASTP